jgi:hypothetical protein
LYCKGPKKEDCTACWEGKSLNLDSKYDKNLDAYPYGTCEDGCKPSKYEEIQKPSESEKSKPEGFWAIDKGWICKNCHDSCYECSGPGENQCKECRYSDSVLKLNEKRILENSADSHNSENTEKRNDIGTCLKCPHDENYKKYPELCNMTNKIELKKIDRPIDGYSGVCFEVSIGNIPAKLYQKLNKVDWN